MRGSDTSTAESGSEADDAISPKALRSYIPHPKLTPVREEVSSWSFRIFSAIALAIASLCHYNCNLKPILLCPLSWLWIMPSGINVVFVSLLGQNGQGYELFYPSPWIWCTCCWQGCGCYMEERATTKDTIRAPRFVVLIRFVVWKNYLGFLLVPDIWYFVRCGLFCENCVQAIWSLLG